MSKPASLFLALLVSVLALPQVWADAEPAIEGDEAALPYLKAVHAKVHPLWADNFLLLAASQLPKDHPINVPSRRVELDVVISAKGGLLEVRVAKSSGSQDFDSSAVATMRAAGEFPLAPEAVLSDDGKVHLRWALARDDRRCSGLTLTHRKLPLVEAVRSLAGQGRDKLAIARLQAADDSERLPGMDAFARAWLDRKENDEDLSVLVAMANAEAGDARGAERLRKTATNPDAPEASQHWAARGLAALKVPTCSLVKSLLVKAATAKSKGERDAAPADPSDQELAQRIVEQQARTRVLRLLHGGADGACLAFAIATAKDRAAKQADRVLAVQALAHGEGAEVKHTLRGLTKDPDPSIVAATILAEARPGAGRGAVFRLIPLLRDKSAAVRAAAAASLVRVGGEDVLPQLYLIYKEKDPSIYTALAVELAKLSGAASAAMLGRLLQKDKHEIQLAAARALAARRDEHAAKPQATLAASDDRELQLLSGLALPKERRDAAVRAQAGESFDRSYSALLRGHARVVAADWLLAQYAMLKPTDLALYLGEWLSTRPPKDK